MLGRCELDCVAFRVVLYVVLVIAELNIGMLFVADRAVLFVGMRFVADRVLFVGKPFVADRAVLFVGKPSVASIVCLQGVCCG